MNRISCGLLVGGALAGSCASALAGPEWIETGDAGSTTATAQQISTSGPLSRLTGNLNGATSVAGTGDFEDVFQFVITQPTSFLVNYADSTLDFSLFLFNVNGIGVLGNLNGPGGTFGGPVLTSQSTDGTGFQLTAPGVYYLAISGQGNVPLSTAGQIFQFTAPLEVSGADGPGGALPLLDWSGVGVTGHYDIMMISGGIIPAPGAVTLLGLALLGRRRSRRDRRGRRA